MPAQDVDTIQPFLHCARLWSRIKPTDHKPIESFTMQESPRVSTELMWLQSVLLVCVDYTKLHGVWGDL